LGQIYGMIDRNALNGVLCRNGCRDLVSFRLAARRDEKFDPFITRKVAGKTGAKNSSAADKKDAFSHSLPS
jgi:hypothetical protein